MFYKNYEFYNSQIIYALKNKSDLPREIERDFI
jgi:hypothetical protein